MRKSDRLEVKYFQQMAVVLIISKASRICLVYDFLSVRGDFAA